MPDNLTPIARLSKRRFEALAGYTRKPLALVLYQELEWYACNDERVLGAVVLDRTDGDFSWVAFGRDEQLRYRAVSQQINYSSSDAARKGLCDALQRIAGAPDEEFYQSDSDAEPVDFFKPMAPPEKLHPTFRVLTGEKRFSPARELIAAMMRYHQDADGNFIQQFQTKAFDPRLWELYLFAVFHELGYARNVEVQSPDFLLQGVLGRMAVEAVTANPPDGGSVSSIWQKQDNFIEYLENAIPIKLAQGLKKKLKKRYWENLPADDIPFVLAVQDFHSTGSMLGVVHAATEYLFGVRHHYVDGRVEVERIREHKYNGRTEPSGFFELPEAENVSAVIVNAQGTLPKFNRIGYIARFGDRDITMIKKEFCRGERNPSDPRPKEFAKFVHLPGYEEDWIEGMVVLHNPKARVPLDPEQLPGAAHEFLQSDGSIVSMLPEFHPDFSTTEIVAGGHDNCSAA